METGSVVETVRAAGRVYRRKGASGLVPTALEYAISRPRIHPRLHWRIAEAYYRRRCRNDVAATAAPPDPFKLEWVSPDLIERHTRREYPPYRDRLWLFGSIRDGDWDRREQPPIDPDYDGPPAELFVADRFERTVLYRSLEAHFAAGVPWDETDLVREARRLVREPAPERVWHECTTDAEIDRRCRRLDDLYESIATNGYRSERERFGTDPSIGFRHCLRHEITVDVGRDGELLLVSGKHRLAVAKLLGLERVPVVFLVRHADWAGRREAVAAGADHAPHPDLRDIEPETG
ncbi:hypothetical protein ACFQGT_15600 [Natrialbaceae archaeon GCM10025810]|uniref:hypothetical protein n=1 Tax=Halovalidus salilacus TaxID=3075124 RepID=UPI00360FADA8